MMVMKRWNVLLACLMIFCVGTLAGCASTARDETAPAQEDELVYEETVSPNEAFVENEEEIVTYTVEIYQQADDTILVRSTSNSAFFEPLQQEFTCDGRITKKDVAISWTTLMGNPSPTADDQLSIADVSITKNGETVGDVKINFVNHGLEIISDATAKAAG